MSLHTTPALKDAIKQLFIDTNHIEWSGEVPEESFLTDPETKLDKAAEAFSDAFSNALDTWLTNTTFIIEPGLQVIGGPTQQFSVIPYTNIDKK